MSGIKVTGLDKLQKALKDSYSLNDVKRTVRFHGTQLQKKMQQEADFKGHLEWQKGVGLVEKSPTGTTKRSIKLHMKDGGFTAEVAPETEYSPYLEYGTRFMEAQPFVTPALNEQGPKFLKDLRELCK